MSDESMGMNRRTFLGLTLSAAAAVEATRPTLLSAEPASDQRIDVNINLFHWPTRRLRFDDTTAMVTMLRTHRVTQAWAGSFEGLLHRDMAGVNARLADECREKGRGILLPFGSVNPKLPDWEEDLRRCAEVHHMKGIRLHPNYHGYKLDDPAFARLLQLAEARRLIVQLTVSMEDVRMMHPLLQVPDVDLAPLAKVLPATPSLRLVITNSPRGIQGPPLQKLLKLAKVYVEIAKIEGVGGVETLLKLLGEDRLLFGSHAPMFYYESAILKLQESVIPPAALEAIHYRNAKTLLGVT